MDLNPTVNPAHFIPANIQKDILEGKDVNVASPLISVNDFADNKYYDYGDVSVVVKSKDPRLNRKVVHPGICSAFFSLSNQEGRVGFVSLHSVVDLGYK